MDQALTDARGVAIGPGDTVIYGFGVGRSIAMAEGVVVGDEAVSLTSTGRVRIRIIRRSYSSGEKPVVDVAPDRIVVLKGVTAIDGDTVAYLPDSTMPTQAELCEAELRRDIARYTEHLTATEVPGWWKDAGHGDLDAYHRFMTGMLEEANRKLRNLP